MNILKLKSEAYTFGFFIPVLLREKKCKLYDAKC